MPGDGCGASIPNVRREWHNRFGCRKGCLWSK